MTKKFVVFDIDGTLYNSHLGVEFLKEMSSLGVIRDVSPEVFDSQYHEWQQAEDKTAYYYEHFNKLYDFHLTGVPRADFEQAGRKIAQHAYPHFYPETMRELTRHKEEGRFVILISKSPEQAVAEIAKLLGADAHWGSAFNFDADDTYVNQFEYADGENDKANIITGMIKKFDLDGEDSCAYGDSVGDISMLHLVANPFAVNPEPTLRAEAVANGWSIMEAEV